MSEPSTLRLADNSVVSNGEVNNLTSPIALLLACPKKVKAAKNYVKIARMKHMTTKDSAASMSKMTSLHTKIDAVLVCKQQFAENQAKIADLCKLHSYYQSSNNKSKMKNMINKIEKLISLDEDIENKEVEKMDGDDIENKEVELLDGEDIENNEVELLDRENSNGEINDNNKMNDDKDYDDMDEDSGDDIDDNNEHDDKDNNNKNQERDRMSDEDKVDNEKIVNDKEIEDSDDISKGSGSKNVEI